MTFLPKSSEYIAPMVLVVIWLVVQSGFYVKFGVQTSVDSTQYIEDAQLIIAGSLPAGRSTWYIGYTSFLALVFSVGGSLTTVIILQIILSGLAAIGLFVVANEIFNNKKVAWLAVFFYLVWIKIHQWNTFIYTESLFTSFSVISFALLVKSRNRWQYILTFLVIAFTFFIRPAGFAFIAGLAWYVVRSLRGSTYKKIVLPLSMILGVGGVLLLNEMLNSYTLIDSYVKGEIIYPDISLGIDAMKESYSIIGHPPLIELLLFIFYNPLYCLKLFSLKFILFFGNVKPYFSVFHNFLIIAILYPLYFFAVKGYLKCPEERKEKYFIFGFVLVQALTVALTTENWDGRFLVPILPFIFLLSAAGIVKTFGTS